MKTIAQFVQDGISTLSELQDALQTAVRLEFSTIPPYLCAQWSIKDERTDPFRSAVPIDPDQWFRLIPITDSG
jgi:hypothetical protein